MPRHGSNSAKARRQRTPPKPDPGSSVLRVGTCGTTPRTGLDGSHFGGRRRRPFGVCARPHPCGPRAARDALGQGTLYTVSRNNRGRRPLEHTTTTPLELFQEKSQERPSGARCRTCNGAQGGVHVLGLRPVRAFPPPLPRRCSLRALPPPSRAVYDRPPDTAPPCP